MNTAKEKAISAALAQIEAAFPVAKSVDIFAAGKSYKGQSREEALEADHIRCESHSSRYI